MEVIKIFEQIRTTKGSIAKSDILKAHSDNELFKTALKMGLDNFTPFNVVKVPKVTTRLEFPLSEYYAWHEFFTVANRCATREVTGNAAIDELYTCFSTVTEDTEKWMRKILQKKLSLGLGAKTVNKIYPGLIPTFEVSLAQKFEEKRIKDKPYVFVEPKLDGIRCFAIVKNGETRLFARSGKLIPNFDQTIGLALSDLGDGCYDGELMGEDFVSLMRQAYRKDDVVVDDTYLALFDYLPLDEWEDGSPSTPCKDRYATLVYKNPDSRKYLKLVDRHEVSDVQKIYELHDEFVGDGLEGAMVKDPFAPYKFGRGYEVMKVKKFHDADLSIIGLEEGTGRHQDKLGAVQVMYNGVMVKVGSGFSDEEREQVWADKDSFLGRMIEVRYQEVTPDGSLRFPTFVCFRNDRE